MRGIERTLERQADAARHKVDGMHRPGAFVVSGTLAGAYVGIAVVLMLSAAGPFVAAGEAPAKLVSGLVFGVALTLVVFAGAELVTSSMMTLTQGVLMRAVRVGPAALTLGVTFVANLLGAVVFGTLVSLSGVIHANLAAHTMLRAMLAAKAEESVGELFVRGILCNVLVCLAIWMCARLRGDVAKLAVIFWALLAFITSGFEHVVANMTTFTLGMLAEAPGATWPIAGANMLWVGLGNLVGGALIVGLAYWHIGGRPRATDSAAGRVVSASVDSSRP
ncbi:formate/nitrite transporter family protein [Microbacterium sp. cx-55]|uniref:formate/nitrite transporter family protein n=1 Tax=unclassified Microbacterium TaxID=2609290 RepID=UPI001CBE0886|nr:MULTISPECIES: formate/nitrite transporter family protein [unclassified Microbacterium]MBZ4486006.1 formate/nitrite transporter family protein [Microbacterium sp. cx-55]MCC4906999.1 formate/nitrite transporter family protein [Microbacterium sp. cx-59]UGB34122.1 formate/nitrite transporter family protein [Microbacterium sp. cx-55]